MPSMPPFIVGDFIAAFPAAFLAEAPGLCLVAILLAAIVAYDRRRTAQAKRERHLRLVSRIKAEQAERVEGVRREA